MSGAIGFFGGAFGSVFDFLRELMGKGIYIWLAVLAVITFSILATAVRRLF